MNLRIAAGVKKWPKTGMSCTRLILNVVAGQATGPIKRPKQTVRKYVHSLDPDFRAAAHCITSLYRARLVSKDIRRRTDK